MDDPADAVRETFGIGEDNDDDLEFHITFPSPTPSGSEGDSKDFVVVNPLGDESPEPVVFLFGWAGADDKILAKYSKIYESCGCITVRYTAPWSYIFKDQEKIRPLSRKLLDLIPEMSLEENPLFFHMFSNLGTAVYQYMAEEMSNNVEYSSIKQQVKGLIFDSCPGKPTANSFINAMGFVLGGNWLYRRLVPAVLFCFVILKTVFDTLKDRLVGNRPKVHWYDYMKSQTSKIPQLFIYSKVDNCVDSNDIEELAAKRKHDGCFVLLRQYEDSQHVSHLKLHKESYTLVCRHFLAECL